jgi:hypothetical protein
MKKIFTLSLSMAILIIVFSLNSAMAEQVTLTDGRCLE